MLDLGDLAAHLNHHTINPAPIRRWPVVCLTGHRPQHLTPAARRWLPGELTRIATRLRDQHGTTTGVSGMALGADTWWAQAVLSVGLRLWAHVPFPQQPNRWHPTDAAEWQKLLDRADEVTIYGGQDGALSRGQVVGLLHARNDGMLDVSSAVIACWRPGKTSGGTASAVRKAVDRGLPVVHVNPDTMRTTMPSPAAWRQALRA